MHAVERLKSFALVLLLGLSVNVFAATDLVTIDAVGRAPDREAAVNAALTEAIARVEGIEIVSERTRTDRSRQMLVRGADGTERKVVLDQNLSESVRSATAGLVDSYRVVSSRDLGGQVEVRVVANVATFKPPGAATHNTRRRIAIYPVNASGTYTFLGDRYRSEEISRRLTQSLVEAMTGSRRFAVLERDRADAVEEELAFLSDPAVRRREAIRLGQALGAAYVIS